jgi:hypothetical protein
MPFPKNSSQDTFKKFFRSQIEDSYTKPEKVLYIYLKVDKDIFDFTFVNRIGSIKQVFEEMNEDLEDKWPEISRVTEDYQLITSYETFHEKYYVEYNWHIYFKKKKHCIIL